MMVEGEGFKFVPSQPAMVKSVLGIVDHFVSMMNTIPRIEGEIGKSSGAVRLLTVATIEEEKVSLSKGRLQVTPST